MMREMGSGEFAEWIAYNELDPIGEYRADLRMGIIAATIANTGFGRPDPPSKVTDFIPDFLGSDADEAEAEAAERAENMRKRFEMIRLMTGGKHIHRGEVVE